VQNLYRRKTGLTCRNCGKWKHETGYADLRPWYLVRWVHDHHNDHYHYRDGVLAKEQCFTNSSDVILNFAWRSVGAVVAQIFCGFSQIDARI